MLIFALKANESTASSSCDADVNTCTPKQICEAATITFDDRLVWSAERSKEKFVNLVFDENKFNVKGSSYSGEASINNIVGNWWNHKILQTDSQISPISGSIKKQVVTFVGKEKIKQYGKVYNVDRFTLKSKDKTLPKDKRLDFNIWYDQENFQIIRVSYSRMGNWEYRLKSFE